MKYYNWHNPYTSYGSASETVKKIVIINVVVFILVHLFRNVSWLAIFGLVPSYAFSKLMIWQLVTYMFLHWDLWHLVINMLMLWFFAPAIEMRWGKRQFLFYYFFTGIGAGVCSILVSSQSGIPIVGASGAIFGILVAYAMMFPETVILLFFIFPMNIRHAVFVLAGINLLGALSNPGSGIAYFAHLGGGLFGYLYLKSEWLKRKVSYFAFSSPKHKLMQKKIQKKQLQQEDLDKRVDLILDKISRHGMKSLTKEEKRILEAKSKLH